LYHPLCHRILVWVFDSTDFHSKAILPKDFIIAQRSEARSGVYPYDGKGARQRAQLKAQLEETEANGFTTFVIQQAGSSEGHGSLTDDKY